VAKCNFGVVWCVQVLRSSQNPAMAMCNFGVLWCVQVDALMNAQVKFIFIETICTDPEVLHQNYLNKMKYSPDYKGVNMQQVRKGN
jgi:hypothetical protein